MKSECQYIKVVRNVEHYSQGCICHRTIACQSRVKRVVEFNGEKYAITDHLMNISQYAITHIATGLAIGSESFLSMKKAQAFLQEYMKNKTITADLYDSIYKSGRLTYPLNDIELYLTKKATS